MTQSTEDHDKILRLADELIEERRKNSLLYKAIPFLVAILPVVLVFGFPVLVYLVYLLYTCILPEIPHKENADYRGFIAFMTTTISVGWGVVSFVALNENK